MIKLFENFEHVAKGYEKQYEEKLKELDAVKKLLPTARMEECGRIGNLPCMWEITCDVHKFVDLGDKGIFAGNAFDSMEDLESVIRDIEEAGGSNIEVSNIEVDDYDKDGTPTELRADTLYFDNVPRYLLQPVTEEEREDLEMEPFWSVPSPDQLDGGPMVPENTSKGRWHGIEEVDPYGEEDWNNDKELWSWRAWWD